MLTSKSRNQSSLLQCSFVQWYTEPRHLYAQSYGQLYFNLYCSCAVRSVVNCMVSGSVGCMVVCMVSFMVSFMVIRFGVWPIERSDVLS